MCPPDARLGLLAIWLLGSWELVAAGKEISGPQVGDKLVSFKMRGVLDDERGKDIDLVQEAAGKPLVLYFLHERNRAAIGLARQVLSDAADRKSAGLTAGFVLLTSDVPGTEEWVGVARQALPRGVPIGISADGPQGPSTYNLSPKVVVTVIVAKDNRVVSNFTFVQPTPDDAPPIAEAIQAVLAK
jgi:hypothetical protein